MEGIVPVIVFLVFVVISIVKAVGEQKKRGEQAKRLDRPVRKSLEELLGAPTQTRQPTQAKAPPTRRTYTAG